VELSLLVTPLQCSLYATEIEVVEPQFRKGVVNTIVGPIKVVKVKLVCSKFLQSPSEKTSQFLGEAPRLAAGLPN